MDLRGFFNFIATELEGVKKRDNIFGIKKQEDEEMYNKIFKLINTSKLDKNLNLNISEEIQDIIFQYYNNKYMESKAGSIPAPLSYYYFDFWLNSKNQSIAILQKALNKYKYSAIDDYGKFDAKTVSSLKDMESNDASKIAIYKMILYYNTKRCFFHISLSERRYRVNWVVRVLKLQTYINTNYNF